MSSTYSTLKIELQATGENTTTWGDITNVNLQALEEAISGSADVAFASANVTISLTNTNAPQTARNLRLRCTGTTAGARNLVVPTIEKAYLVKNECADTITVKTSAGTGIAVPAGKTLWVVADGTNVVDAVNYLSALSVGAALGVTGATTLSSTLGVTDAATFSDDVAVTGNVDIGGTLGVSDDVTLGLGSTLNVTATSNLGVVSISGAVTISGLGNYANDAAAAIGGVPVTGLYRNGSVLMIRVS